MADAIDGGAVDGMDPDDDVDESSALLGRGCGSST